MLHSIIIEILFKLIIYSMLSAGIWILVSPVILPAYKSFKFLSDKKLIGSMNIQYMTAHGVNIALYRHCDLLLQATWKWYKSGTTVKFIIISFSFLSSSLSVYYQMTKTWSASILFGVLTALLPYMILRVRLELIRSNTSHQLVPAIYILLASYRISSKDIYYAILRSVDKMENSTLRKSFIILAKSIQCHKNDTEIEHAIALFVFKIQTSWAKQLGVLISSAVIDGRDIEQSLSNIVSDMKHGQQIIEEEKSNSHDTVIMGYLPLLAFPLTIIFLQTISGRFRVLHFQFKTSQGLTSFTITSLICAAGFILATVFKNPKNDL